MDGLIDQKFNIRFVQTVQKYPVIYNTKSKGYKKNFFTEAAWKAIAKKLNCDTLPLKKKWTNLRTILSRKLSQQESGEYVPPYYLHDHIKFVIPFLRKSQKSVALNKTIKNGTVNQGMKEEKGEECMDIHYETDPEQNADENEITEAIDEISQDPMYFLYDEDDSVSPNASELLPDHKEKRKTVNRDVHVSKPPDNQTRRNHTSKNSNFTQTSPHVASTFAENLESEQLATSKNAKIQFLYSILPDLNEMSNSQMRHFKSRVLLLVDKVLKEH